MSETVSKRLAVTFNDGLPLGTHGTFTYQGERWIAVPLTKYNHILGITDRLVGVLFRVRAQLTAWVASDPENAAKIVQILAVADSTELEIQKAKAQTS